MKGIESGLELECRHYFLVIKFLVALIIEPGSLHGNLRRLEICLCDFVCCLVRHLIDNKQRLALLHILSLGHIHCGNPP